jgi:hypothetical protein
MESLKTRRGDNLITTFQLLSYYFLKILPILSRIISCNLWILAPMIQTRILARGENSPQVKKMICKWLYDISTHWKVHVAITYDVTLDITYHWPPLGWTAYQLPPGRVKNIVVCRRIDLHSIVTPLEGIMRLVLQRPHWLVTWGHPT